MDKYIREIEEIATKCSCSQSDGYSQIMRICEAIRTDEEQGLLLRLPCKVGDTVYYIDDYYVYKDKVNSIDIRKENEEYVFTIAYMDYKMTDFGNTVFLTQEEADQRLKEMESDSDG